MGNTLPSAKSPIQLGWIPYWNLVPMRAEVQKQTRNVQVQAGHPAMVNRWLSESRVVAAPCSSICLLRYPRHEFALPLGVSTDGPVHSVYLGYGEEMAETVHEIRRQHADLASMFQQIRQAYGKDCRGMAGALWRLRQELPVVSTQAPALKLSAASASSVTLAKIFYRLWFGDTAFERVLREEQGMAISDFSAKPRLELVIGDEALQRRCSFYGILDLGKMWKEFCGLPFVFAAWQSLGPLPSGIRQVLVEAAVRAEAMMKVEPSNYLPDIPVCDDKGAPIDLRGYWRAIDYQLGAEEIQGLLLFLCIASYFAADAMHEEVLVKIMRWQEQSLVIS